MRGHPLLAHAIRTCQTNLPIHVHGNDPSALPAVIRKDKGGRLSRHPQPGHPAAPVANFCIALLTRNGSLQKTNRSVVSFIINSSAMLANRARFRGVERAMLQCRKRNAALRLCSLFTPRSMPMSIVKRTTPCCRRTPEIFRNSTEADKNMTTIAINSDTSALRGRFANIFSRFGAMFAHRARSRRVTTELSHLTDRELADIGINRYDIPRIAAEHS